MNGTKMTNERQELQGESKETAAAERLRECGSRYEAFEALEDHGPHGAAAFEELRVAERRLAGPYRPAADRMRWCEASLRRLRLDMASGKSTRSWSLAERVMAVSDGLPWKSRREVGVQLLTLGHSGDASDPAVRDRLLLLFAHTTFTDRARISGEEPLGVDESHLPSLGYGLALIERFATAGRPLKEVRPVLKSMWSTALLRDKLALDHEIAWPEGRAWFVPVTEAWSALATQKGVAADRGAAWLVSQLETMDSILNDRDACFAALRTLGQARPEAIARMLEGGKTELAQAIHCGHERLVHKGLKRELKPLRAKACRMIRVGLR